MISLIIEVIYYMLLLFLAIKSIASIRQENFIARCFLKIYIIFTALLELCSYALLITHPEISTGIFYNFYCLFNIVIFYFFYRIYFHQRNLKIFTLIFFSTLLFYFCSTKFYKSDFDVSVGITISLYYISASLLWFYQKVKAFDEYKITDDPVFLISTALLMWSCFFIFRVTPMFLFDETDKGFSQFLRTFQYAINILMYSMFYISMIKFERKLQ